VGWCVWVLHDQVCVCTWASVYVVVANKMYNAVCIYCAVFSANAHRVTQVKGETFIVEQSCLHS